MPTNKKHHATFQYVNAPLTTDVITSLRAAGLNPTEIKHTVTASLEEDLRWGPDITTTAIISQNVLASADVAARRPGVLAGLPVALAILAVIGMPRSGIEVLRADGEKLEPGDSVLRINGPLYNLLPAERTLLNFLTHLSGIATATRAWVNALDGTGCVVRDTRKTIPGLRSLEKYAVRCGGGTNHRMGLGDAALIKDNHIAAAGSITVTIEAVRRAAPTLPLEVECDTLAQVREALAAKVKLILLDNMSLEDITSAVALGAAYPATRFEASGGLRLDNARAIAKTGVDFIAVGALTHSSPALDLGLDIRQDAS
jgi:nicotinate-nucleotide pyrophosphorylase (carboxylating)